MRRKMSNRFFAAVMFVALCCTPKQGCAKYLCRTSARGTEFSGTLSLSAAGRTCLHWDDPLVDLELTKNDSPYRLPEGNYTSALNYCRNPSNDDQGPWCFTTDQCGSVVKEYCNVPFCAPHQEHCKSSTLGRSYTGDLNYTKAGRVCQRWDSLEPHFHTKTNPALYPEDSLADAVNFCRNPDSESTGPWCYTLNPSVRWEYCDIPMCDTSSQITSISAIEHTMTTDSFSDGDLESCQHLSSPSASDIRLSIATISSWMQLNVELAFTSDEVTSCKDSHFMAYHSGDLGSCGLLTMCNWVDVVTAEEKGFCRFTCNCKDTCQSVTLAIPSQLKDFHLCEVKVWLG